MAGNRERNRKKEGERGDAALRARRRYSPQARRRIVAAWLYSGLGADEVATLVCVSPATLRRWKAQLGWEYEEVLLGDGFWGEG